jgi:flagellar hook protein FlgE
MIGGLWNGISGLNSFEKALNVESNNISNVSTVGYKEDVISFQDMMYANLYGRGSSVENVSKAMSQQGGIKLTSGEYDVAIEGRGYFIVGNEAPNGTLETYYTRAGNFARAESGFLQTQNGMNILGLNSVSVPANTKFTDEYTKVIASQAIGSPTLLQTINAKSTDYTTSAVNDDINDSGNNYKNKASKIRDVEALIVDYKNNLSLYSSNSSAGSPSSVAEIKNADLSPYMNNLTKENDKIEITINNTKITQLFDTDMVTTLKKFSNKISDVAGLTSSVDTTTGLLNIKSLIPGKEVKFSNLVINESALNPINDKEAVIGTGKGLVDSSKAALVTAIERADADFLEIASSIDLTGQENLNVNKIQLSLENLNISNIDGNVEITDGIIYVKDGENKFLVGKVQTAFFTNEQGLSPSGNNLYQVSKDSGDAKYAGDLNKLVGTSLEQSKANLGNSLTALLIYQKAFEANSKSITTSDEMLQTAIQLKK